MRTSAKPFNIPSHPPGVVCGSVCVCGGGGVLPYWDSTGVPRESLLFLALASPKDSTFSICAAKNDHPFHDLS